MLASGDKGGTALAVGAASRSWGAVYLHVQAEVRLSHDGLGGGRVGRRAGILAGCLCVELGLCVLAALGDCVLAAVEKLTGGRGRLLGPDPATTFVTSGPEFGRRTTAILTGAAGAAGAGLGKNIL